MRRALALLLLGVLARGEPDAGLPDGLFSPDAFDRPLASRLAIGDAPPECTLEREYLFGCAPYAGGPHLNGPIDVRTADAPYERRSDSQLELEYPPTADVALRSYQAGTALFRELTSAWEVLPTSPSATVSVRGATLPLSQIALFSESDNALDGRTYPLELQFVHFVPPQAGLDPFVIVCVFFEKAAVSTPWLRALLGATDNVTNTIPLQSELLDRVLSAEVATYSGWGQVLTMEDNPGRKPDGRIGCSPDTLTVISRAILPVSADDLCALTDRDKFTRRPLPLWSNDGVNVTRTRWSNGLPPPAGRLTCGMCLRHRCTLYGANKCASRYHFTEPQGEEVWQCRCACCANMCIDDPAERKHCPRKPLLPPAPLAESQAREPPPRASGADEPRAAPPGLAPLLAVGGVVAAAAAWWRLRRSARAADSTASRRTVRSSVVLQ